MSIRLIAPLAFGLALSPCAFAQTGQPAPEKSKGQWYVSSSIAAVDGIGYAYPGSAVADVFSITYRTDSHTGAAIEESIGYAFANGFRAEAAITLQAFDNASTVFRAEIVAPPFNDVINTNIPGDRIRTTGLSLNGYCDFPAQGRLRPYAGAGAGLINVKIRDGVINADDTVLNLQAMAGVTYRATHALSVFLEGRWQDVPDLDLRTFDLGTSERILADASFSTASLRAGLRFSF